MNANAQVLATVARTLNAYANVTGNLPTMGSVFIPGLNILVRAKMVCGLVSSAVAEFPSGVKFTLKDDKIS